MPKPTAHPSREELSAYSLGQLPEERAVSIDTHISQCEPCCETIVELSSEDTFAGLLQEAGRLPTDLTLDSDSSTAKSSSTSEDIPSPLAEHPRYEIVRLIGKGGMGDVYEARHRMMERTVALKVIKQELMRKPEAVDRFHREVKAAAQLAHPNVVTAYDAEQAGDIHFMVMEFVDGVDLSQMVKDRGALPVAEACAYICQAAIGLQHAHVRGMVHRDIKPHNLMVTTDGTVKILDFGLASLAPKAIADADSVEARGDLTVAGAIMGTPDFISPEQANDARKADIRSDIYSLGATLYFLLSGRPLFADGSVMEKLKGHAQFEPEPLDSLRDDVPAELAIIISKMIAKDPEERFQTPVEVADALSKFKVAVAGGAVSASTEVEKAKPAFVALTLRRVLPSLAVAIAAVLALGLLSVKGCGDSARETQNAYTDLSSYLQTGKKTKHNTYSVNALNVLTDSSEGRKLLAKIDADSEEFSFANFEVDGAKHAIDWAAALIHDDRVTPRQRELTVTVQHESGSYGPVGSPPSQFHLESVRITKGGGFSGPKLVIGFAASDRPKDRQVVQETFQLKPGKRYEVDVDLVDVIDGSIDWIDLWRNGKEKASGVFIKVSDGAAAAGAPGTSPNGKPVSECAAIQVALRKHYMDKHPLFAASVNQKSNILSDLSKLNDREWLRQIGELGTNSPVSEVINSFPGKPSVTFTEVTQASRNEVLVVCVNLYRNADETCRVEVTKKQRKKRAGEPVAVGEPITEEEVRKLVRRVVKDSDFKQLQGDWEAVSVTEGGKQLTAEKGFGSLRLQITGNSFAVTETSPNGEKSEPDTGRIEIGSTTNPKTIDFIDRDQPDNRSVGIYELRDGALRICMVEQGGTDVPRGERMTDVKHATRPTTFNSPAGSNMLLMEFRRGTNNVLSHQLIEPGGGESANANAPGRIQRLSNATIYHLKDGVFIHEVFDGADHYYLVDDNIIESCELTQEGLGYVKENGNVGVAQRAPVGEILGILRDSDSRSLATKWRSDEAAIKRVIKSFDADATVESVRNMTRR